MARLTIGGREFDLAPFKLGALKRAAPFLDRINTRTGSLNTAASSMELIMENAEDIMQVLAIGTSKIDPACDTAWLADEAGFEDIPALSQTFTELMQDSGLAPRGAHAPGEAPAPAAPEAAGASLSE